jgi:hypothetical protein
LLSNLIKPLFHLLNHYSYLKRVRIEAKLSKKRENESLRTFYT